jgi:hypothetical protein
MATYKLIDIEKLEAFLEDVANTIRAVTGKTDKITVNLNNTGGDQSATSSIKGEINNLTKTAIHDAINQFVVTDKNPHKTVFLNGGPPRENAFRNSGVENICFENCPTITGMLFYEDYDIQTVCFKDLTFLGAEVFTEVRNLAKLIIETPAVPNSAVSPCVLEDISAFSSTLIESWGEDAGIFVPEDAVSLYENDSNWANFPIFPIPSKDTDPEGYQALYGVFEEALV